jgi:hypothetical protein
VSYIKFDDEAGIRWGVYGNKATGVASAAAKHGASPRRPGIWFVSSLGEVRHAPMDPVAVPTRAVLRSMEVEALRRVLANATVVVPPPA